MGSDAAKKAAPARPEPQPVELRTVRIREVQRSAAGRGYVLPTAAQRPELWAGSLDTDSDSESGAEESGVTGAPP